MGGVLLVSTALFRNIMKHDEMEKHLVSADAVVLDERYAIDISTLHLDKHAMRYGLY